MRHVLGLGHPRPARCAPLPDVNGLREEPGPA